MNVALIEIYVYVTNTHNCIDVAGCTQYRFASNYCSRYSFMYHKTWGFNCRTTTNMFDDCFDFDWRLCWLNAALWKLIFIISLVL